MITFWVVSLVSLVHLCSYCKGTIVLFVKQGNEGYQRGVVRKKILIYVVSDWYIMKCGFLKFALRQCDLWKASPSPSSSQPPPAPPKGGEPQFAHWRINKDIIANLQRIGHPLPSEGLGEASSANRSSPPFGGVGGGFLFWGLGGFFTFFCYAVTRYTLHFYISHVNKGIKIVEFKGKKSIIKQRVIKCRFLR